ncbi:MAG: DsbA family oxidoreductase [Acidimicrobiales bacterium]
MKFAINWDYRCPFARNMHEHLVTALKAGAPWEVTFLPFSLSQVHVEEGEPSVFDDPTHANDLLANAVGMIAQAEYPEQFYELHLALFRTRHDEAKNISDWEVLASVIESVGLDPESFRRRIEEGTVLKEFREIHERTVEQNQVFGVPTFFIDGRAAFVRVMTRPKGDAALARRTIEYVLDTLGNHQEFNEIKFTTIDR